MTLTEQEVNQIEKLTGDYVSVFEISYASAASYLADEFREKNPYRNPTRDETVEMQERARVSAHNVSPIWTVKQIGTGRIL